MFFDPDNYSSGPRDYSTAPDTDDAPSGVILWIVFAVLALGVAMIWALS